jgi:outer membrane receptor protein involved in Fe transport
MEESMKSHSHLLRGMRRTLACSAFAAAVISPATAQNQPANPADNETEQTVVVTGSRIPQPNQESPSPIQVLSSENIEGTGRSDISDVINQLPQIFNNDLGQDLGNRTSGLTTAGGVATADLRGLGPNRTLVMIDGRRLGQGSPYTFIQQPAPDLDQIPLFMVDRVEVATGGASAVYGSDAIAGVVNFILKKDFQGIQFDAQIGQNWHDNHNDLAQGLVRDFGETPLTGSSRDGKNKLFNMLLGTNFAEGQGNITAWFTYYHQDPVSSGDRDFGQCQLAANQTVEDGPIDSAVCAGSSNSNFFNPQTGPNANTTAFHVIGNEFVEFGTGAPTPPAFFNSQEFIYMQRADDRYLAGLNAHYDLSDHVQPYFQFGFMDDRTSQVVAPAALFRGSNPNDIVTGNYYVNCGNPFLSAQQQAILGCTSGQITALNQADRANQVNIEIGRRNIEGGNRSSNYQHTNYRGVLGTRGDITDAWNYDVYAQYYYTQFRSDNNGYLFFRNIDNALLATTDSVTGAARCVSNDPQCVPYNIWQEGGVTPEALSYITTIGTGTGDTTLRTYHADFTGQLGEYGIKSPLANDGLAVNVGWEHRTESANFQPDAAEQSGQLSGFGSAATAIDATVSVDEQFLELRVPLLQDKPFVQELVLSPGFRRSDYSSSGTVNTYKLDLSWAPIDDIRFRGSYQRAIRAASVVELFNQPLVGLIQLGDDPCSDEAAVRASLAECLNTVSAAQAAAFTAAYNAGTIPNAILGQLSQRTGGNPTLEPEKAKSYSFGFTFNPTAVPNLTGSIDWWDIRVDRVIGVIPAQLILDQCLGTADPAFCSQLVRKPNNFSLTGNAVNTGGYIIQQNLNIGTNRIRGIDLQTSYKLNLPANLGSMRLGLNGSYLLKAITQPLPGAASYDCAGLFGVTCQTVNPRWRHILNLTWQTPLEALEVGTNWRFVGKVAMDQNDPDPTLRFSAFGVYNSFDAQLPNMSYVDLFARWHAWKSLEVRGGINNILDKDPPLATFEITSGGAANTYSTYDSLGRQLYLAFTAKF